MPPRGLPGHKQDTTGVLWLPGSSAHAASWPLALPLIRSRLPVVPPRLPGQGKQVTCYDLSQRGGAGEQVLP